GSPRSTGREPRHSSPAVHQIHICGVHPATSSVNEERGTDPICRSGCDVVEFEHSHGVVAKKLRPDSVLEWHVAQLAETAFDGDAGRIVTGVHDLFGAAGIRE